MCWMRGQQANQLRSTLREFYPAALLAFDDLTHRRCTRRAGRSLPAGPRPALSQTRSLPRCGAGDAMPHQRAGRSDPGGAARRAAHARTADRRRIGRIRARVGPGRRRADPSISGLEGQLDVYFGQHPAAALIRSLPGLGTILGARVLAEFGDVPGRYATAKSRKNYAGTSPITKASGTKQIVLARYTSNQRLGDPIDPRPSRRSRPRPAPAPTTTNTEPPATDTTKHSAR